MFKSFLGDWACLGFRFRISDARDPVVDRGPGRMLLYPPPLKGCRLIHLGLYPSVFGILERDPRGLRWLI